MKDFPLNELLTASEVSQLPNAIISIFSHLKKTSKSANYPLPSYLRCCRFQLQCPCSRWQFRLAESISRDMTNRLLEILQKKRLMYLDYEDFDKYASEARKVFQTWEEQFEGSSNVGKGNDGFRYCLSWFTMRCPDARNQRSIEEVSQGPKPRKDAIDHQCGASTPTSRKNSNHQKFQEAAHWTERGCCPCPTFGYWGDWCHHWDQRGIQRVERQRDPSSFQRCDLLLLLRD
jgi:hypothetical protein